MKVVTVANKRPVEAYYLYGEFLESLKRHGHEPLILGTGPGEYGGLGSKPRLLKQAIDAGRITDERIIFCDSFDVVFGAAPELAVDIAEEFFDGKIVFNAERACFPDESLAAKHPQCRSSFRFLNSGFAVGRTSDFYTMLDWMKADEIPNDSRNADGSGCHPNDQLFFQHAFLSGELPIALDTTVIICQTLCGVTDRDLDFSGPEIENRETGGWPAVWHFNGPAKTNGLADPILRKLGLR